MYQTYARYMVAEGARTLDLMLAKNAIAGNGLLTYISLILARRICWRIGRS